MRLVSLAGLILIFTLSARADVGFVAFGDWGMGNTPQKLVAAGLQTFCSNRENHCEFVAALGDNFYPDGVKSTEGPYWEDRFKAIYGPLGVTFYPALGNHDYGGNVEAQIQYTAVSQGRWNMPARYYTFTKDIAEFFVIDTNRFDAKQQAWLTEKLSASTATWKFVYGHHPVYSYGMHGNTRQLERNLLPILRDRADFYLAGHDHDKQVLKPEGRTHFVVIGTGAETRRVKKGERTIFASARLGFGHFQVTPRTVTLRLLLENGSTVEHTQVYRKP